MGERDYFAEFLTQEFIPLYSSWRTQNSNGAIYLVLGPASQRELLTKNPSWPVHIGDGIPSFSGSTDGSNATYHAGNEDGFLPLAFIRSGEGILESFPEPLQEFVLLLNLYAAQGSRVFYQIDEAGNKSKAIEIISENEIIARKDLVLQFQAAKQLDLIVQVDSVQFVGNLESNNKELIFRSDLEYCGHYPFGDFSPEGYRYFGKFISPAGQISSSGIWPFESKEVIEEEFVISDEGGAVQKVRLSSDSKYDPNSFLRNQNINYLEPVQFKRDLLRKYFGNPDIYTVTDSALKCGSLWSISIDIDSEESLFVYAGDLLRVLPPQEWSYWKAFNIIRDSEISNSAFRRDFLGQFSEPNQADHRFRAIFTLFQEDWYRAFGWYIFRPLLSEDDYVLKTLHLPLTDGNKDFDEFVLKLTKLTTDAIDVEYLIDFEGVSNKHKTHPIDGIAEWLETKKFENVDGLRTTLLNIQWLRSKGAAHPKKPTYTAECRDRHGMSPGIQLSEKICEELCSILNSLSEHFID